jgi:hypothetical protein
MWLAGERAMMAVMCRAAATIVLAVLAVLSGAASGCGPAGSFACASDEQCQAGAEAGTCQANGYCSFLDESCPSGQRFGDAAPPGVGNTCVEPADGTGTTIASTGDAMPPPDPDDGPLDGPSLDTSEGSSTAPALDEGTSEDPATSSSSTTTGASTDDTTTGERSPCAWEPIDDFDDAMLDPMWTISADSGASVEELGGQLEVTLPVSLIQWITGGVSMELPPMSGGWARVRITEIESPHLSLTSGLNFGNGTCALQLYTSDSTIRAHRWHTDGSNLQLATESNWELPVWLQLRQDETGELHFEWSEDEVVWQELASGTFPECGDITVPLTVLVGVGGQPVMSGVRSFDAFAACVP